MLEGLGLEIHRLGYSSKLVVLPILAWGATFFAQLGRPLPVASAEIHATDSNPLRLIDNVNLNTIGNRHWASESVKAPDGRANGWAADERAAAN